MNYIQSYYIKYFFYEELAFIKRNIGHLFKMLCTTQPLALSIFYGK